MAPQDAIGEEDAQVTDTTLDADEDVLCCLASNRLRRRPRVTLEIGASENQI